VYKHLKKIFNSTAFKNTVKSSKTLKNLLSEPLLEHIGNCLDHIKMFEKYSEMGFDPAKFILDYDKHKCSAHELAELKRYYKQKAVTIARRSIFMLGSLLLCVRISTKTLIIRHVLTGSINLTPNYSRY